MIGDATEHVLEIGKRFDTVQLGGRHQRVDQRRAAGAVMRAREKIILSPQRHRPDRVFDQIIVDLQTPVGEIFFQLRPLPQHVADGFADRALGQDL